MTELEFVRNKIVDLEDELQHYTMVEKDKCKELYIREDLKYFKNIEQALLELRAIKEVSREALTELNEIIEYITEDKKVKYKATILFDCKIIKDALLKTIKGKSE